MHIRIRVGVLAALAILATAIASPNEAKADCVKFAAWVEWSNGDPNTYLTPWDENHCVVPTSHPTVLEPDAGYNDPSASPPAPRRVRAKGALVWPLP